MRYFDLQDFIRSDDSYFIGSIISAAASHINNAANMKNARDMQREAIQAQKEMNERNIEFQQGINDQNIAFQREVNDIMRHDANNAIGIKKRDLINAGYSTADPSLTGAQTASLGTPNLTAPQVQSEFSPEMAEQVLQTRRDFSSGILDSIKLLSDIKLQEAQAENLNSNTTGQNIQNKWSDVEHQKQYEALVQSIDNMKKDGVLKEAQTYKAMKEASVLHSQLELLGHNIKLAEMNNKFRPYEFVNAFNQGLATIGEIQARIANTKADTNNKYIQGKIYELDRQFRAVEVYFAKMGINFNSSGIVDTIGRIATAPDGAKVLPLMLDFVGDTYNGIIERLGFKDSNSTVYNTPDLYPQGVKGLFNKTVFHGLREPVRTGSVVRWGSDW